MDSAIFNDLVMQVCRVLFKETEGKEDYTEWLDIRDTLVEIGEAHLVGRTARNKIRNCVDDFDCRAEMRATGPSPTRMYAAQESLEAEMDIVAHRKPVESDDGRPVVQTCEDQLNAQMASLGDRLDALEESRAALAASRRVIQEQLRQEEGSRTLTCAYCGQEYPPGTPATQHELLTEHGCKCQEHPIRADLDDLIRTWRYGSTPEMGSRVMELMSKYHIDIEEP